MQWWCAAQGVPWTWSWQAYPGVWLFVLVLAGLYRGLRSRFPESDRPRFRAWMYGLGVAMLWIALDWPVGALGAGYLASVHMVQYLLIAMIAPPLLLMGLPRGVFRRLVDGPAGVGLRVLSHPLSAMAVFVGIMAWTHWPPVVDTLMVTQAGSFLLDLLWLFSGLVFWWPVVAPEPSRSWLHEPGKVGYLIVATLVNTGVFAYLTFSPLPLYATYELAPPVTGLATRDDQLVAGLLMKMGGAVVLWTAITILFFRWYRRSEAAEAVVRTGAVLWVAAAAAGCDPGGTSGEAAGRWSPVAGLEAGPAVMGEPTMPGRGAIYLQLRNPGDAERVVDSLSVPDGGRASLHRTETAEGVMRMRPVAELVLAPGETVTLEPGGLHVMVEDLPGTLTAGDTLRLGVRTRGPEPAEGVIPVRVVPLSELDGVLARESGAGR